MGVGVGIGVGAGVTGETAMGSSPPLDPPHPTRVAVAPVSHANAMRRSMPRPVRSPELIECRPLWAAIARCSPVRNDELVTSTTARPGRLRLRRLRQSERPCVDAPLDTRGCLRDLIAQVQVLPCVRPVDAAIITAAGLYGDRGSGPHRFCALEAHGHFTGFPDPVF